MYVVKKSKCSYSTSFNPLNLLKDFVKQISFIIERFRLTTMNQSCEILDAWFIGSRVQSAVLLTMCLLFSSAVVALNGTKSPTVMFAFVHKTFESDFNLANNRPAVARRAMIVQTFHPNFTTSFSQQIFQSLFTLFYFSEIFPQGLVSSLLMLKKNDFSLPREINGKRLFCALESGIAEKKSEISFLF